MNESLFVILGNQLFHPRELKKLGCEEVFMAEDFGLCTYEKHHKLKLYLYLTSMREYKDELESASIKVNYFKLDDRKRNDDYFSFLIKFLNKQKISTINIFEIEDKPFEELLVSNLEDSKISINTHDSPMFLLSKNEFNSLSKGTKTYRMASFYKEMRKKYNILVDEEGKPFGGKWSFDEENRKKIPAGTDIPKLPTFNLSKHHSEIVELIKENFNTHPGSIDNIWFPVRRKDVHKQLNEFFKQRFSNFGIYEDAMIESENFLFHSCLSANLNIGLLTPNEVFNKALKYAEKESIPINSLEGFIRQIIGWREFIRGIYVEQGNFQKSQNYWNHKNKLSSSWYEGNTGLVPLDDAIKTTIKDGYIHHIPRLMVISNIMNLCEIHPKEIYRWFMEMYIDSSEWVMVPNVFGMATYADGGLMSTKPYTCGSNYILKMSNYKKGEWCDILDGLYWRFTEKNKEFYLSNPRLSMIARNLDKMDKKRKENIFSKAEEFINKNTL